METLVKADIFFFITSIIIVIWGILGVVIAAYIIKILRSVSELTEETKANVSRIMADIDDVRADLKGGVKTTLRYTKAFAGAFGVKQVLGFLVKTLTSAIKQKKKRRTRSRDDEDDE